MKIRELPMREYSSPRRVLATPVMAKEASREKIVLAVKPKSLDDMGFLVRESVGAKTFEYWMPETMFLKTHIMTKQYTIGEALLLLLDGAIIQRTSWSGHEFIRFDDSILLEEDGSKATTPKKAVALRAAGITRIQIFDDPLNKDKKEIVYSDWNPTQADLFAKDFQVVKIDFTKLND